MLSHHSGRLCTWREAGLGTQAFSIEELRNHTRRGTGFLARAIKPATQIEYLKKTQRSVDQRNTDCTKKWLQSFSSREKHAITLITLASVEKWKNFPTCARYLRTWVEVFFWEGKDCFGSTLLLRRKETVNFNFLRTAFFGLFDKHRFQAAKS